MSQATDKRRVIVIYASGPHDLSNWHEGLRDANVIGEVREAMAEGRLFCCIPNDLAPRAVTKHLWGLELYPPHLKMSRFRVPEKSQLQYAQLYGQVFE